MYLQKMVFKGNKKIKKQQKIRLVTLANIGLTALQVRGRRGTRDEGRGTRDEVIT